MSPWTTPRVMDRVGWSTAARTRVWTARRSVREDTQKPFKQLQQHGRRWYFYRFRALWPGRGLGDHDELLSATILTPRGPVQVLCIYISRDCRWCVRSFASRACSLTLSTIDPLFIGATTAHSPFMPLNHPMVLTDHDSDLAQDGRNPRFTCIP